MLGQALPGAGALADLYTAPAAAKTVVSTLKVCNQAAAPTTFRVSVAVAGAADERKQYVYYDAPIDANDTFSATEGWTIAATDVIRVRSANGLVSFNLFGAEVT